MGLTSRWYKFQCQVIWKKLEIPYDILQGPKIVLFAYVLPANFNQGVLTFVVHSLTVQSNDDVTNRCEKSIGPTAMWQLIPVTGPWWPSKTSPIPALLHEDQHEQNLSELCKGMMALKLQFRLFVITSPNLEQLPYTTENETTFTVI